MPNRIAHADDKKAGGTAGAAPRRGLLPDVPGEGIFQVTERDPVLRMRRTEARAGADCGSAADSRGLIALTQSLCGSMVARYGNIIG